MKYFCIILLALCSCNNATTVKKTAQIETAENRSELEKYAAWLLGNWHHVMPEGHGMEIWEQQSDTSYGGLAYYIVGKDTVSFESIRLVQRGKDLIYIPTVRSQNDGKPVEFKLTSTANYQLVFENANHDYPKRISYEQISNTYMIARTSGIVEGKLKMDEFPMLKK